MSQTQLSRVPQVTVIESPDKREICIIQEETTSHFYGISISFASLVIVVALLIFGAIVFIKIHNPHDIEPPAQSTVVVPNSNSIIWNLDNNGMVFPHSSERVLTYEDIDNLKNTDGYDPNVLLQCAINDLYARNGCIFEEEDTTQFYSDFKWYEAKYSKEEVVSMLNDVEIKNLNFLTKIRREGGLLPTINS